MRNQAKIKKGVYAKMNIIQAKTINKSIFKKVILLCLCFVLSLMFTGCFKKPKPQQQTIIKKEFDVRALLSKLTEINNYSYKVSTDYSAEDGVDFASTYTLLGDRFKEIRERGNQTDHLYIDLGEKMMYSYNPWMSIYTKVPMDEYIEENFYSSKDNILYTMHIPDDLETWHYTLISEDTEVAEESCVVVKDGEWVGERTLYISKNSGFPLKIEYEDFNVTVTNIEIENVTDNDLTVPEGAEYKEDWPSLSLF